LTLRWQRKTTLVHAFGLLLRRQWWFTRLTTTTTAEARPESEMGTEKKGWQSRHPATNTLPKGVKAMSEMLNSVTTAVKLVVAGIGGSGAKATAVNFIKDASGVREWAWLPNAIASQVRAGTVILAETVSRSSKVETTYTDKTGAVVDLKVPKRQVFLGGKVVVTAPESEPLAPCDFTVTDEAKVYASRVDAKSVGAATAEGDSSEPF